MVKTLSTVELLAFQAGDREVFRKIYKHYYKSIYSIALIIVKNGMDADDISLETFLKLWQRKKKFRSAEAINGFLLVTARNASLDYLRAAQKKVRAHKEIRYLARTEESYKHYGLPKKDIMQEVYSSVVVLPPKCREVFSLIFIHGKRTKEIAKQLNISLSTVLTHKSHALKLIRSELIRKNFLPEG